MACYIDAEEFLKDLHNSKILFKGTYAQGILFFGLFDNIINRQPTADVVEVCRCKDCKHLGCKLSKDKYACNNLCMPYCSADDFCSCGERRTDNGN